MKMKMNRTVFVCFFDVCFLFELKSLIYKVPDLFKTYILTKGNFGSSIETREVRHEVTPSDLSIQKQVLQP